MSWTPELESIELTGNGKESASLPELRSKLPGSDVEGVRHDEAGQKTRNAVTGLRFGHSGSPRLFPGDWRKLG